MPRNNTDTTRYTACYEDGTPVDWLSWEEIERMEVGACVSP